MASFDNALGSAEGSIGELSCNKRTASGYSVTIGGFANHDLLSAAIWQTENISVAERPDLNSGKYHPGTRLLYSEKERFMDKVR